MGTVRGVPFAAAFEYVSRQHGELTRVSGRVYRAKDGSTRNEHSGEDGIVAEIFNVSLDRLVLLAGPSGAVLMDQRRADFFDPAFAEASTETGGWLFYKDQPIHTDEYAVLHGVRCERIRFGLIETPGDKGLWWSDELKMALLDEVTLDQGEVAYEITELDRTEPSANLFVAP